MISNAEHAHHALEAKVAEKYRAQGFDVIFEPRKEDLPFDLGMYRPDLVAKKLPTEGYVIEVKGSISQTPVDRYREIAEVVAQHTGWSFLLVTGEDVPLNAPDNDDHDLLTWEQMLQRRAQAERLLRLGEIEGAFLSFWGILEAALRRQAQKMSIPIEHFPTLSLINHLYSQGELSIQHFDQAKALQAIRNRFVHGYQAPPFDEPTRKLQELVNELLALWSNDVPEAIVSQKEGPPDA